MPYCLKCGTKVEDQNTCCPACGAQLKDDAPEVQTPDQPTNPTPQVPVEANQPKKPENPMNPKLGKADFSFLKYLAAGLILITLGSSMIFEITNPVLGTGGFYTLVALAIGLIILLSGVYYVFAWRKHHASLKPREKTPDKNPVQPSL